ncbi:MAG TPA: hypothetical protein IAB64_05190 [Candidatus Coproplasma excrementavium]|nr:hypothetical protein [Candidatus Coproplasma excrementavium]
MNGLFTVFIIPPYFLTGLGRKIGFDNFSLTELSACHPADKKINASARLNPARRRSFYYNGTKAPVAPHAEIPQQTNVALISTAARIWGAVPVLNSPLPISRLFYAKVFPLSNDTAKQKLNYFLYPYAALSPYMEKHSL